MTSQLRWPVLVTALLAVALTGCAAPLPPPGPTPGFTSKAEAFAAAEKTYRAYVDALNEVDLSDPETFEAVYAWTTGEANAEARTTFTRMHADGWVVEGQSEPTVIDLHTDTVRKVRLAICLDVSGVKLTDDSGRSVVTDDRPAVQSMLVTLTLAPQSETNLLIADFAGRNGEPSCA